MSSLPSLGRAYYNGYEFDSSTVTTGVEIRPMQDAAGRTVTHCVYAITLQSKLSGSATSAVVKDATARLTKQGGVFIYTGRGVGDLSINTGKVRDVMWGPVPRILSVKPLGGQAVTLTWQVEVAIPTCGDAKYAFAPMEFCFKVTYDIDRAGYTRSAPMPGSSASR